MFRITNAAITPGTQPHKVNRKTMIIDPHPFPITASGGNIMANKTLKKLIDFVILIDELICRKNRRIVTKSLTFITKDSRLALGALVIKRTKIT